MKMRFSIGDEIGLGPVAAAITDRQRLFVAAVDGFADYYQLTDVTGIKLPDGLRDGDTLWR